MDRSMNMIEMEEKRRPDQPSLLSPLHPLEPSVDQRAVVDYDLSTIHLGERQDPDAARSARMMMINDQEDCLSVTMEGGKLLHGRQFTQELVVDGLSLNASSGDDGEEEDDPDSSSKLLLIKDEISSLVLWRSPLRTVYYATHQLAQLTRQCAFWILTHRKICLSVTTLVALFTLMLHLEGSHLPYVQHLYKKILWCLYWCGLGILSSVGLGTGLHTFILYLGPHIASVTLAAYECNSLDFPEPPYPDEIICPQTVAAASSITVWTIMSKVRLEAFMWGAGTALGELPPYFISRAHRLAGEMQDDEILEELEELEELVPGLEGDISSGSDSGLVKKSVVAHHHSWAQQIKAKMVVLMKRMGFFGILACASIPNPLFDLAGIICGYSLISFWTFFGATLLGKAVIKMHIQKLIVIIVFNETYVQSLLAACKNIPYIGSTIHNPLRDYLTQQKRSLHRGADQTIHSKSPSWIAFLFESFVILMVTYFLVSIINSMAQSNLKQRFMKKQPSSSNGKQTSNTTQTKQQKKD